MSSQCGHCGSLMCTEERKLFKYGVKRRNTSKYIFTLCCQNGKYKVGPVKPRPKELRQLLDGADPDSQYFFKHIRLINSNLAFAGLSANERDMPSGHGPPIVRMHGAVYHVIGSLFPRKMCRSSCQSTYMIPKWNSQTGFVTALMTLP